MKGKTKIEDEREGSNEKKPFKRHQKSADERIKNPLRNLLELKPMKRSIRTNGFNGVVYQQVVNGKENLNRKTIGHHVNMRKLLLKKLFEIVRIVGLENPFDGPNESSDAKKLVMSM